VPRIMRTSQAVAAGSSHREAALSASEQTKTRALERERVVLWAALVAADALAVGLGFLVAHLLRFQADLPLFDPQGGPAYYFYTTLVFRLIPLWLIVFALFRLYDGNMLFGGWQEYMNIFNACTFSITLIMALAFLDTAFVIARGWLLLAWVTTTLSVMTGRFAMRRVVYALRLRGRLVTNALVVGANGEGVSIAQQLRDAPTAGVRLVGFLDDALPEGTEVLPGLRVLGKISDSGEVSARYGVRELMVATSAPHREQMVDFLQWQWGRSDPVNVRLSTGLYEILTTGVQVRDVGYVPFLSVNQVKLTGFDVVLKRTMDLILTTLALLILTVMLPVIAFIIRRDSPGPAIYRRRVVGVGGKEFDAFKLRTMVQNADEALKQDKELWEKYQGDFKLKDDPRITRIGRFLRRTSLDELPQLWNVIRGEMSLVGPRMITKPELEKYGKRAMNLLTVKPGITGLWQVSGRSDASYEERVQLDMYYIRNWSLWLDIQLIFQTVIVVLKRRGAY
jgi:exopolysaccharide biosynthesis polyprenyl glycosylphosphotransferase